MADNITTLASRLEPILRRKLRPGKTTIINNYYNVSSGGGGGGGGGSVDLSWVVPQSRVLLASSPLRIDGGASADLSVDRTLSVLLNASGAIVDSSGLRVALDSSGGLEVNSNALRVKLQSPSGLDRTSGGMAISDGVAGNGLTITSKVIAVGTPSTLTTTTTNAVTTTSHTHNLDTASDVGTTPAVKILASTGAGGLILGTLNVKGALTVTNGGDFSVAGSGAYAGSQVIMASSSGGNVGILMTPDPQFALDVNGPVRAQYFIGPHAIQLKNVLLLAHYDGRQPFETNFYGEPNGHMGQVASTSGGVIYREGMFGTKAVQIANGTTNLVVNPSFEVNVTDGWTYFQSGTGGAVTRTSTRSRVGLYQARITASSTGNSGIYTSDIALANGATIHMQCRVYRLSAGAAELQVYDNTNGVTRANAVSVLDNQWEHLYCTWTNTTGGSVNVRFRIWNTAGGTGQNIGVDSCQAEIGTDATPYADGSMGAGHAWTGTAHNSTSTRSIANLNYPTSGNISTARGTVMAWIYRVGTGSADTVLRLDGTVAGAIILRGNGSQLQGFWGTAGGVGGGTVPARTWTHVAMTYNTVTLRIYVNGIEVGNIADSGFSGDPTTMYVGRTAGGGNLLNGLIDDLAILSQPLDANAIRAVYESNAPVFAESSRFSFRATPKGLVWADDDGLKIVDTDGNPVAIFYGGEASGYSWGGKSLDPGDILFGRYGASDGGWLYWDRDGVSGKPYLSIGYATTQVFAIDAGGATLDGVLDISSTGGIYQGATGSFASPGNGLKVWNNAGVGQIAAYATGVFQAGFQNYGFEAGTTHRLDENGLTVSVIYNNGSEYGIRFKSGGQQNASVYYQSYGVSGTDYSDVVFSAGGISGTHERARAIIRAQRFGSAMSASVQMRAVDNADVADNTKGAWVYLDEGVGNAGTVISQVPSGGSIKSIVNAVERLKIYTQSDFTGDVQINSGNFNMNSGGNTTSGGVLRLGGFSDNLGRAKPTAAYSVANAGTVVLDVAFNGFLFIMCTSEPSLAIFGLRSNGAPYEIFDSTGVYSNVSGTASSHNLYLSGGTSGNLTLQNNRGVTRSYSIIAFGSAGSF